MKSFSFCLLVVGAVSLVTCWRCADASVTGSCFNAELYMRTETINIMKTLKRLFMMSSTNNAPPNADDITPCLGGDLLVDLFTARYLQYSSTRRHKRALFVNFTAQPEHKWNTTIPYYFNFTGVTTDTLISALQYVEQQTCIRFTAASGFTIPYLSVMLGASCTTFMGRSTDTIATPFIVTTACANTFGEIINLLANVLGMLPENLRPDRDAYIYVNSSNIDSSDLANLQPVPGFINASIYDYASVTHAYSKQFASGAGYTILPYDPLYLKVIGQHVEWSFLDAKAVNFFYCNDVCSSSLSCERGGYVDPNNCAQCRCPDGFAGTTCQSLAPQSNGNCGSQQELTATSSDQYITSPGYSTRYGIYTNCTWRISAPSSSLKIQLKFVDAFGIFEDASTSACCHWVEIRYKGSLNTTGPRFCGRQRPPNSLVTDAREVLVLFRSNYNADSIENVGFKLLYRLVTCDPAWSTTVRPNSNSVGAELVSYPLSESGCRDHCAYDLPGCVAVDIDHNKRPYPACWVHVNAGDLDQVYTTNGVTQHRINTTYPDCRVSTSATTSTVTGDCVPWRSFRDTNSVGASRDTTITTVDDCRTACVNNPSCVAVDWDGSGDSSAGCWIHTDARNLLQQYGAPGVTQYQLTRCSGFTATSSTSTTTTSTSTTTTTPTTTTTTTTTRPTTTTRTFPPTPPASTSTATTACVPTWVTADNRNSIFGIAQHGVATVDDCRETCLADSRCVGVDWNHAGPVYCWLHRDRLNGPYTTVNVTQHALVARCDPTSERTTTTTTSTTSTTTTSPTTSPSGCVPTWIERAGVNSVGARPDSSLTTLSQCQSACVSNPQCVAVDWNSSPRYGDAPCWVHYNADNLRRRYATPGVTQYELTERCASHPASTTTATAECRVTWIIRNNTHSAGATLIVEPISADDCLNRCAVSSTCVAVDLVTSCSPPQCWMHHDRRNIQRRYRGVNVTQYELSNRCATIAPPDSGCGGAGAWPGQLCQPCIVAVWPRRVCVEQRWVTSYSRRGWVTQLVTVHIACTRATCTSGAVLTVQQGVQSCVWVGWTNWSSCNSRCRGVQQRRYWNLVGHRYSVSHSQSRSCNTWC